LFIAITLCSNHHYLTNYKELEIDKFEVALSPWVFENVSVIPWRLLLNQNDLARFNNLTNFKETLHSLHSGMTFIYKLDDHYLTVAVATNDKSPRHALTFLKNMQEILNMGAFFYDIFKNKLESLHEKNLPDVSGIILNDKNFYCVEKFSRQWNDIQRFYPIFNPIGV
jgi:hypothetical protein